MLYLPNRSPPSSSSSEVKLASWVPLPLKCQVQQLLYGKQAYTTYGGQRSIRGQILHMLIPTSSRGLYTQRVSRLMPQMAKLQQRLESVLKPPLAATDAYEATPELLS